VPKKLVRAIFRTCNLVTQTLNGELENQCGALDWPTVVLSSVGLLLRIDLVTNQGSQQVVDCTRGGSKMIVEPSDNLIIRDVPICLGQLPENAKIGAIGDGAIRTTMGNNKDNGEQRAI